MMSGRALWGRWTTYVYIACLLIPTTVLLLGNPEPEQLVFGLLLTAAGAALLFVSPKNPGGRIAKTFSFTIEDLDVASGEAFPHYEVPPKADFRKRVRFACPPLVDCCFPALFRELDPAGWENLKQTHALEVSVETTPSFRDQLYAVADSYAENHQDNRVDVAIASAAAVDRMQYADHGQTKKAVNAPVCVLPVLQQFNAYYLFAKRQSLLEYLESQGGSLQLQQAVMHVTTATSTTTLHRLLKSTSAERLLVPVMSALLRDADTLVEIGADLDAAIIFYWEQIVVPDNARLRPSIRFAAAEQDTIATTFEKFLRSEQLSMYMGGIAQSAFLLNRSHANGEFVLLADPQDIRYVNVNSFVCSPRLASHRRDTLIRLCGWWFDLVNRFRRQYLFPEEGSKALEHMIRSGLPSEDSDTTLSLIPEGFDANDMARLLLFMKGHSSEEIGSFLFPSLYAATSGELELISKLERNDAICRLLREFPGFGRTAMTSEQGEAKSRATPR